jgi:hypothetical protein
LYIGKNIKQNKGKFRKLVIIVLAILFFIQFTSCKHIEQPIVPIVPTSPIILTYPTSSNVIIGQQLSDTNLEGEFNVEGDLHYISSNHYFNDLGGYVEEWEFIPSDLENYLIITGYVTIHVYQYVITFEEHDGYDIEDVYFYGSTTIEERPITLKNDYHFDGWSLVENNDNFIEFPYVAIGNLTLHAQYRFHSIEKIVYAKITSGEATQGVYGYSVSALWGANGLPSDPLGTYDQYSPIPGSIAGEVIIADMYNGEHVTYTGFFRQTLITNIVFPINLMSIRSFENCFELGPKLVIPKLVKTIGLYGFMHCYSLKDLVIEDGTVPLYMSSYAFAEDNIESLTLNRVEIIEDYVFARNNLATLVIPPSVKIIVDGAFMINKLENVTILGNNLEIVYNQVFANNNIKSISFPSKTKLYPEAFKNCLELEEINISDEQLSQMVQLLHNEYISKYTTIITEITRDPSYYESNAQAGYYSGSETLFVKFNKLSLEVLNLLFEAFFHHYQDVMIKIKYSFIILIKMEY